jgi:hypothetical protein
MGNQVHLPKTPDQMVLRICRELGSKKNIIILNDESHQCYRRKPNNEGEVITGEAKSCDEDARIWISGMNRLNRCQRRRNLFPPASRMPTGTERILTLKRSLLAQMGTGHQDVQSPGRRVNRGISESTRKASGSIRPLVS